MSRCHTAGFEEAAKTEVAEKVMQCAAKALALTGLAVLTDPEVRSRMHREFKEAAGGGRSR